MIRRLAGWDLLAVVAGLWVLGALLGPVWQWWSPPGPAGYVVGGASLASVQPNETEAFVAADGRFVTITLAVGVLAALLVWFAHVRRTALTVLALAAGGLGGALATAAVGAALRGPGRRYSCGTGGAYCVDHLALAVHARGFLLVEAAAAVLVFGLCVAFAASDDLARRPDESVGERGEPRVSA